MSRIAAIFDRTGAPVDSGALHSIVNRMVRRGPDGRDFRFEGNVALGHGHFWTTPEEQNERQPLRLAGMPFTVTFDGRLDNRSELLSCLDVTLDESARLSDAALLLRAYGRWGEDCVEHLIGEFAFVLHDERRGELLLARDAMGERTLFYRFADSQLLVASEPWAIAEENGLGCELDDAAVAHFFAFETPADGRSLFRGVHELLPAEVIVVSASGERRRRYWQPDFTVHQRGRSDQDFAEEFLALFQESVRCRLRATTVVAVQMSGGLDSASVASVAAQMLAPDPLTTVSYVFDELKDCDERDYIESMQARWGVRSLQISGDDAWPLKELRKWSESPNVPERNPFRLVKDRAFRLAANEGARVLLTGCYGDELFSRAEDWLADLILEGRFGEAAKELTSNVRRNGVVETLGAPSARRVPGRFLGPLLTPWRRRRTGFTRPWLTTSAAETVFREVLPFDPDFVLRRTLAQVRANESSGELGFDLELRHPFRDRRLVEFVLSIPAHQSFNGGVYKHVLRNAMKGLLPEPIRTRRHRTKLSPLYFRGMARERLTLKTVLQKADSGWRGYVREDWMETRWDPTKALTETGPEALVPWMCASYEVWNKSLNRTDGRDGAENAAE